MNLPESAIQSLMPPDYNIVKWVEANRTLDRKSSAETGYKRISRTPYLYPLFEWFLDEKIKEIVIQKPAQIGITDWVVDLILWIAKNDPSPTALFLADQETARKLMRFRIEPAFKELGLVKRKANRNQQQDISKFEVQLKNGFYLSVGWGSSISQTASMTFKRVFCDEINKPGYDVIKNEGDTLSRIRERMETFGDSKFILLSTPTIDTGNITQEFENCDIKYDFCIPCPFCGVYQPLEFSQVIWIGGSKATREEIQKTARYKCRDCGELWTDKQRQESIAHGKAIARKEASYRERVAYQLDRLNSLFKGGIMANMVNNFLFSQSNPQKLQNFINSTCGRPWIPRISPGQDVMQKTVFSCRNGLAKMVLPEETLAIVAGVDVQNKGFWYRLRAICRDSTTHGITEGFVPTWEELEAIIYAEYSGLKVWRCLIDTGGGKDQESYISRTEETYLWIRKNQGRGVELWGCKGSSHSMPTKIKIGAPIEKTPSGKAIPGGVRIVQVNTDRCKDSLIFKIEHTVEAPESPGCWFVHRETPDWYFQQVTAEEKRRDRKGIVEWKQVRADNHILDCEVYIDAAIDPEFFGGIRPLLVREKRKQQILQAAPVADPKNIASDPFFRRY